MKMPGGRPVGSVKSSTEKRVSVRFSERWNAFRKSLSESHDGAVTILLDLYERYGGKNETNAPALTPIKATKEEKKKQLCSSTPHAKKTLSTTTHSLRLSRLQLRSPDPGNETINSITDESLFLPNNEYRQAEKLSAPLPTVSFLCERNDSDLGSREDTTKERERYSALNESLPFDDWLHVRVQDRSEISSFFPDSTICDDIESDPTYTPCDDAESDYSSCSSDDDDHDDDDDEDASNSQGTVLYLHFLWIKFDTNPMVGLEAAG